MEAVSSSNIKIANCPLGCDDCKVIYTNKETGFKIICGCNCHKFKK